MSATSRSGMSSQTSRSSMSRYSASSSLTAATTEEGKLAQMRYFEKVRMKCAEIAPEILRGTTELPKYDKLRKFARLKNILKSRTRFYDPEVIEETMKLITDVDRSETIRMDGNISRTIYNRLIESRGFDLYGRLRNKVILEQQQALRLGEGVDLEDEIQVPTVFDNKKEMLKQLATTTPAWKIDKIEPYNAPVGFAPNPVVHPHSLGNENYFSYDGDWRHGKMEGNGVYVFQDGLKYEGQFKANWPEGQGKAVYHGGEAMYEGDWVKGRFQGTGEMKCHGGSHYQGGFVLGRRNGKGVLKYGVGLVYEGEFRDGKPHGRGYMTSELTGHSFEGTFVNGRIEVSGVLITPAPDYQRVVRIWEKKKKKEGNAEGAEAEGEEGEEEEEDDDGTPDGFSLPGVVRMYLKELEDEKIADRKRDEATFGKFRTMQMNDYVANARNVLHASRAKAKRDVMIARLKAQEEIKREIREAKAKAIQDLIEEEDAKKGLLERVMMQIGMMKEEGAEVKRNDEDEDEEHEEGGDAGEGGGGGEGDAPAIEGYGGDQRALTEGGDDGNGGDGDGGNELALADEDRGGTLISR